MSVNRLSALPDDLLRRVLYFAPAKEGGSTAVLSRRWRSLWRTSGAVNVELRLDDTGLITDYSLKGETFFLGAASALAAVHAHSSKASRFTLHVEANCSYDIETVLTCLRMGALLSNPAIQHVEELRIGAAETPDMRRRRSWSTSSSGPDTRKFYKLSFGTLPSEALRELHIVNCRHLEPPPSSRVTFPRLTKLRLQGCFASHADLQRVVEAAPQLATLHLESFSVPREDTVGITKDGSAIKQSCLQLLCPTVTTLVLEDCHWPEVQGGLELDAPELLYFIYKGFVHHCHRLSLHAPSNMVSVELYLTVSTYSKDQICIPFWQFVQNFNKTKVLKLKLHCAIDYIAVVDKTEELIGNRLFRNLERLELEVRHCEPASEIAAMALANFLHLCPVARDLHLKQSS